MGKIVKRLKIFGDVGEAEAEVLFDSGAGSSLIREDLARRLFGSLRRPRAPKTFRGVNGTTAFKASYICTLELELKDTILEGTFYVVSGMPREVLVGVDFLQAWEITLDMKNEDFTIGVDPQAIEIA